MFEIEKLTHKGLSRVEKLAQLTWPSTFKNILSQEQIEYMLAWMYNLETLEKQLNAGHQFYILKENNIDLGFIGIELNYQNTRKLRIHKIYVLPTAQGKGVGKRLIDHILEHVATINNQTHLHLNVNKYNAAVNFYKHIGFKTTKEEDIDIGNGFFMNDFVMEKALFANEERVD